MVDSKEKILIRGVNWIGDAVMTIPAIRTIRSTYKGAELHLLVKPTISPLFERDPNIQKLIIYDKKFDSIGGKLTLANILKKENFTKAFLLQNAFDAALLAFMAKIPERVGYNRDKRGFLLTTPIPFKNDDRRIHHIDYYLNLLRAFGIKAEYSIPYIFQSLVERVDARKKLSIMKKPIVGINAGATYGSAKRWLPDRFAEVISLFLQELKGSVVIFGAKNEEYISKDIEGIVRKTLAHKKDFSLESRLLNLTGKTTVRELINLISECDIFISNDSGPMHLSYAVGTPVIAIFGSTSPELTGPPKNGNVVLKANVDCSPCFRRSCIYNEIRCMLKITSEEVFAAIRQVLPKNKAVFFDRDGTLCEEVNYLSRREDFKIFKDIESIKKLKEGGFLLIGITNQSGIARKIVDETFVKEINKIFIDKYWFDDFLYCPHHPGENCFCRKPELGMLYQSKLKYRIDLSNSYFIGDTDIDMLLAKTVGGKGILVTTGKQRESIYADYIVSSLKEAVNYILDKKNS
ncbi:MAG: lipopolysaccharide heptosyltransferase II [Thermodesulfovibrionales bacterium]|nr:lipopolysaccharide heptosyltransferase II [Thermodesulfovibrionales bacterium]